jgi:hypothetical protein
MRIRLALPATLLAFTTSAWLCSGTASARSEDAQRANSQAVVAQHVPAPKLLALTRPAADRLGASDTGHAAAVHADARSSERWYCTPAGCAGPSASPSGAVFGFAAATLAAAWISRKRPADRC